jgi:hypothetical protein
VLLGFSFLPGYRQLFPFLYELLATKESSTARP